MTTRPSSQRPQQRGVVLLFCLIILVVLLAGGVAVVRSMNSSLFSAGNLAFKRDLVNRGELAAAQVMTLFKTGALAGSADTADMKAENYSATSLPVNDKGIPTALLSDTAYDAKASKKIGNDADAVTIRYVIDRMCNDVGTPASLGAKGCVYAPLTTQVLGGSSQRAKDDLPPPSSLIYRLTIRVDGPRNTQVFLQSSFTKPDL
ncbi:hypothetical protein QTI33_15725 [Variovorax sp. J22P271]|uniref:pilus assembly PilX family protein n=1 Tax=Variovorax davisae TaxID=3053515 RepID=UPI0025771E42|nr:hypothetical protein [Variovorax sp. J22P271]MDM0033582.1 hypothetical protein [Variovorax sp. J22P271]